MHSGSGQEFEFRTFIALWPPEAARQRMAEAVRKWERRLGTRVAKWVNPQHFHLTLVFLGNVRATTLDGLKERFRGGFAGIAPAEVQISGAGAFPDLARPKILWVGLEGNADALDAIQARAEESAKGYGEPRDSKRFEPHLTVAHFEWLDREQLGFLKRLAVHPEETDFGSWTIDRVDLMRSDLGSEGSKYTVLESVPLLG